MGWGGDTYLQAEGSCFLDVWECLKAGLVLPIHWQWGWVGDGTGWPIDMAVSTGPPFVLLRCTNVFCLFTVQHIVLAQTFNRWIGTQLLVYTMLERPEFVNLFLKLSNPFPHHAIESAGLTRLTAPRKLPDLKFH